MASTRIPAEAHEGLPSRAVTDFSQRRPWRKRRLPVSHPRKPQAAPAIPASRRSRTCGMGILPPRDSTASFRRLPARTDTTCQPISVNTRVRSPHCIHERGSAPKAGASGRYEAACSPGSPGSRVGDHRRMRIDAPGDASGPCCPHTVRNVTGQPARKAVAHLRDAGVRTFAFTGRWSSKPVGTVLAQHPHAGIFRLDRVVLVASMGPHQAGRHGMIFVPGVATCDLTRLPSEPACAGGPVVLRSTS